MHSISSKVEKETFLEYGNTEIGRLMNVYSCGKGIGSVEISRQRNRLGIEDNMLMFITEGKGELSICGKNYVFSKNSIIYVPVGVPYEIEENCKWYFLHFISELPVSRFGFPKDNVFTIEEGCILETLFKRLIFEADSLAENHLELTSTRALEIFFEIGKLYSRKIKDKRFTDGVDKVINTINKGVSGIATIKEYAALSGLSESKFRKRFKERTGMTPKEYITECRVIQIRKELEESDSKLKELKCLGYFSHYSYFVQFVKKHLGMSPEMYVNKIKKERYKKG